MCIEMVSNLFLISLCNVASSDAFAHERANHITIVLATLGDAAKRSYQIVQGKVCRISIFRIE